jgi:hypothetical protein
MFKFYLDNTLVADPLNWADFSETLERDEVLKGLLPKYEVKLQFDGGGYEYLYNQYVLNGFCKLVEIKIEGKCENTYEPIFNGYIFISDCKFVLDRCTVECSVEDDNFGARIYNNKKLKTYLNTGKSKNGIDITSAPVYSTTLFVPTTGVLSFSRDLIFVYDAFKFLIDFMSDGKIGFQSTYLDYTLGVSGETLVRYLTVGNGKSLRLNLQQTANISFEELFVEVNKKYPIGFTITKDSTGKPIMIIENKDYFYDANPIYTINNIDNLSQSFDNELLYSKVIFGEDIPSYDATIHSFGQIQFLSFKKEEYIIQGECNIDKALDLAGFFRSDTDTLEEILVTNTTNTIWDNDTFFIEVIYGATCQAFQFPNPTTNALPFYYNGNLTNNKIAERYSLAGNIAAYLGDGDIGFRASKNSNQDNTSVEMRNCGNIVPPALQTTPEYLVGFDNDYTAPNYDAAGNWATNQYTSSVDGNYAFQLAIRVTPSRSAGLDPSGCNSFPIGTSWNRNFRIVLRLKKYNSVSTLIQESTEYFPSSSGFWEAAGSYDCIMNPIFFLAAGDFCNVSYQIESIPLFYTLDSGLKMTIIADINHTYIETTATTTGGGIYEVSDAKNYFVSKFEFVAPLNEDYYKTLKLDLSKSIIINHDGVNNKEVWIKKMVRRFSNGETNFEMISNLDSI